jgi:predicted NBD/HSP70 family sugar kinase
MMETYLDLKQAADSRLQNKINRSLIFHYLHEHGQSTRVQVARDIHISEPTVSRIIADLLAGGYVLEGGKLVTEGGKRPSLIKVNPSKGYIAVVDLVKARLRMAVTNFNGDIVARRDGFVITDSAAICEELIGALRSFFVELRNLPDGSFDERLLLAICLGMPAETDPQTGAPASGSLYDSWYGIPFRRILEETFKLPVFVERDVVLSVLAEKNYGKGKNYRNIAYVEVSNGVATGIIMDNRVIRSTGALGFAGEAEYVRAIRKQPGGHSATHYDRHFGSMRRLVEDAQRIQQSDPRSTLGVTSDIGERTICAADVFIAAYDGDSRACELVADMVSVLSRGIANLVLILHPQIVVVGGELSTMPHVEELFLAPVREKVDGMVPFEVPPIELFLMHEDAVLLGGAVAAMQNLLMEEFPYKGTMSPPA